MTTSSMRSHWFGRCAMKNPINKRLKRDLWQNRGRYLAIFIITTALIAICSGFYVSNTIFMKSYYGSWKTGNVEDGQITTALEIPEKDMDVFSKQNLEVEPEFYRECTEGKDTLRIFKNREKINLPGYYEGENPQTDREIALDRIYAENHDIKIGDTLHTGGTDFKVVGILALPDYSSLMKSRSDLLMDTFHFGVATVTDKGFERLKEGTESFCYVFTFKGETPKKEKQVDIITDLSKDLAGRNIMVTDAVLRYVNTNIMYFENDADGDVPMMNTALGLFLLMIAFVYTVLAKSTIEDEAPIIGTLLSMGYRRRELILHYLRIPVYITLLAVLVGNVIAYTGMYRIYQKMYLGSYSLFPSPVEFHLNAFLITSVTPLVLIIAVNLIMLIRCLRFAPLRFLRRNLKRRRKRSVREWKGVRFMTRFRLRIFQSNVATYVVMLGGIFLANMLMVFALSIGPIIDGYMNDIKTKFPTDYQYILRVPVEKSDAEKFSVYTGEKRQEKLERDFEIQVYGVEKNTRYFDVSDLKGNEVIVNLSAEKKFDLKKGSTLELKDKLTGETKSFKVAGINEYPVGVAIFGRREEINRIFDQPEGYFNGYFSKKALSFDDKEVLQKVDRETLTGMGDQVTKLMRSFIPILVILGLTAYLVVMYVLTKIIIDRSKLSIGYLKIFGYRKREIAGIYIRLSSIIVIAELLICIGLELLSIEPLLTITTMKLSSYMRIVKTPDIYLISTLIGLVSYLAVRFVHVRRIYRGDMVEALKENQG